MNRFNVSLKKNNDDYGYKSNYDVKNDKSNYSSSVKTMDHRTNRQNIGSAEFVSIPKKIISVKSSNITKKNYNDEYIEQNKKKNPDMNNYMQYIKNNMNTRSNQNSRENVKNKYENMNSENSDNDSYNSNNSDNESDSMSSRDTNVINIKKNDIILDENATSAEIISFKVFNKSEPIITDVNMFKDDNGIRFNFDINKNAISLPCYTINYKTNREYFLATISKSNTENTLSRMIDFYKLELLQNLSITFIVMDLYTHSTARVIQELVVDLTHYLDKSFLAKLNRKKLLQNNNDKHNDKRNDRDYDIQNDKQNNSDKHKYNFPQQKVDQYNKKKHDNKPPEPRVLKKSKNFMF